MKIEPVVLANVIVLSGVENVPRARVALVDAVKGDQAAGICGRRRAQIDRVEKLKIVEFAPIPSATAASAMAVKAGLRFICLKANRRSRPRRNLSR